MGGRPAPERRRGRRAAPICATSLALLALDGKDLSGVPIRERNATLATLRGGAKRRHCLE